jgi:hypothetical protein
MPTSFPGSYTLGWISFLWRFVKDRLFVSPLPANVVELQTGITAAVAEVTSEMLRAKKLTTGGTSAALPMEVTLNHNYPR